MLAGPAGAQDSWLSVAGRGQRLWSYQTPSWGGRAMPGEQDQGSRGLHPRTLSILPSPEDEHPAWAVLGYRHVGTPSQGHEKKGSSAPNACGFPATATSPEQNPLFSLPHLLSGARDGSHLP